MEPIVKLGTELPQGKVIAIRKGSVDIDTGNSVVSLTFTTVENEVLKDG